MLQEVGKPKIKQCFPEKVAFDARKAFNARKVALFMLLDLLQSQGLQRFVIICVSAANIAHQASDNSAMTLQESMIAFQQPRQSMIILRAIDTLQQSSLSRDKPKEPVVN
jgi:hypothetical protein